jgi:hypothetical protein
MYYRYTDAHNIHNCLVKRMLYIMLNDKNNDKNNNHNNDKKKERYSRRASREQLESFIQL